MQNNSLLNYSKRRETISPKQEDSKMIFLIEYDRSAGQIVKFETYQESERQRAEDSQLELELRLNQGGVAHEVVLLEAATEKALRKTHRRYFEDLFDLTRSPAH